MKALALLCLLAGVALAQPTPGPPGLVRVNHDATMTGDGRMLTPLGTRLAVGGGLQGGGAVSLGLIPCSTGQVLAWSGTAYVCADSASKVAGTFHNLACFTPDGSHVGNCLATDDGTTFALVPGFLSARESDGALTGTTGVFTKTDGAGSVLAGISVSANTAVSGSGRWGVEGATSGTIDTTSADQEVDALFATSQATRGSGTHNVISVGVRAEAANGTGITPYAYLSTGGSPMSQAGAATFGSTVGVTGNAWAAALITGGASGSKWSSGTGVPAINCTKGDHFSRTDGGAGTTDYDCTATNTWTAISSTTGTVTSVATGAGLTGGTITTTGTLSLAINSGTTQTCASDKAVTALTGVGLTTCTSFYDSPGTGLATGATANIVKLADTAVTPGSYTYGSFTVDQQGRLTAASSGTAPATGTGTANTTTKWSSSSVLTNGWALDDATSWGVSGKFLITEATGAFVGSSTAHIVGAITADSTLTAGQTSIGTTSLAGGELDVVLATNTSIAPGAWNSQWATFGAAAGSTGAALGISYDSGHGSILTALSPGVAYQRLSLNANNFIWYLSSAQSMSLSSAGLLTVGAGADAPGASNAAAIVTNAGTTCSEVRDSTNHVEAEDCVSSSGGFGGTFTNHSYFLQTNATNALKINTSQQVEALQNFLVDGNTTIGNANTNTLTVTAKVASHVYYTGTTPTYSCAGATVHGNDMSGWIDTPDTNCTLTFAGTFGARTSCNANASTNIPVGVDVDATGATVVFTMGSKPSRMTYSCTGEL